MINKISSEKRDFDDILIQPSESSNIDSRSLVDPYYDSGKILPIFVSPMDTVIDEDNYIKFINSGMNICLPRGVKIDYYINSENQFIFNSYSLNSIVNKIKNKEYPGDYTLIDSANGHMTKLFKIVKILKDRYPEMVLMVGNVANPKTYSLLSIAGADYIRVGIGNGHGCLTTQNTGVGYPMASLISECYNESINLDNPAKIVADGGMKEYSDIIKALALGADYVMLGSILNKCIESSGDDYIKFIFKWKISNKLSKKLFNIKFFKNRLRKKFRGMSTKEVQIKWGKNIIKTSEGVIRWRVPEYTIEQWTENFTDYLKSSMSYTNSNTLDKFIGKVKMNIISNKSYDRFNK